MHFYIFKRNETLGRTSAPPQGNKHVQLRES